MARSIGFENNETFRAVHVTRYVQTGKTVTGYEGPYSKIGTARARVTYWQNMRRSRNYSEHVDGWVERAETKWERVPE
jgi:hypothetical protein